MNLGDDYCEQKLYIVRSLSSRRAWVVIASDEREATSGLQLGTGPYGVEESDVVSGVVVEGVDFKLS